jgi:hypothetical protein
MFKGEDGLGTRFTSLIVLVALLVGGIWLVSGGGAPPKKKTPHESFFRIKASLIAEGEPLEFNVVVACSTTVYGGGGDGAGYRVKQYPVYYAIRIKNNHAVQLVTQDGCDGMTTDNGKVPANYLPPLLWYESADDLSLGYLYLTDDAFEGKRSKLTFIKASVHKATREEFEVWHKADDSKNLITPERQPYLNDLRNSGFKLTPEVEKDPRLFWKYVAVNNCYAIRRIPMHPALQSYIRSIRPAGSGKYWAVEYTENAALMDKIKDLINFTEWQILKERPKANEPLLDAIPVKPFGGYNLSQYGPPSGVPSRGYARRKGGGHKFNGGVQPYVMAETYPLFSNTGAPWIKQGFLKDGRIIVTAPLDDESWKGFAACYEANDPLRDAINRYLKQDNQSELFRFGRFEFPFDSFGSATGTDERYIFEDDQFMLIAFSFSLT